MKAWIFAIIVISASFCVGVVYTKMLMTHIKMNRIYKVDQI